MFHDYIPLLLLSTAAGLMAVAFYFWKGLESDNPRPYAAVFAAAGLVSLAVGLHMTLTWPIPAVQLADGTSLNLMYANVAFGESSVLFGAIMLAAALAIAKGWNVIHVTIFAFFVGIAAIVMGAQILNLRLTQSPVLTAVGFILTGAIAVASPLVLLQRRIRLYRQVLAMLLVVASAIWAVIAYGAYWSHIERFSR